MSRLRHKHEHQRAAGGKVVSYAGGGSNVMKEAHATENTPGKKRGGRVHHHGEGEEAKMHAGKRARGGGVHAHGKHHVHHHHASGGHVEVHHHHRKRGGHVGGHEHEHEHEKKRARGGAVGSDKRPLSSAAHIKFMPEEKGGGKGAGPANEQS